MSWPNGIPDICPNPVNDFDCPMFMYVGEEDSSSCRGRPGQVCPNKNIPYGIELILDLHNCDPSTFTRKSIASYFEELCKLIDMERCDLYFWDYENELEEYEKAEDHLKGISAVQFIMTSNITIHTLDVLKKVFINIFTCKDFNREEAEIFTRKWFKGRVVNTKALTRK